MKRTWQAVGVIAGAAGLVLGGMGLAVATGHDPAAKQKGSSARARAAAAAVAPDPGQSLFTPIPPCRVVDTRTIGKVSSVGSTFSVSDSSIFPGQGGNSGGCGIPASAVAVAANLVAVNATGTGFLRAFPAGSPAPTASVLNYGTATVGNELPLSVRPSSSFGLTVTASTPTNLVVDVTGYYSPQIEAYVYPNGVVHSGTSAVISGQLVATGTYKVTVNRDVGACVATATAGLPPYTAAAFTGDNAVYVYVGSTDSGSYVPENEAFNLTVTC